jgi:hypothetical protein
MENSNDTIGNQIRDLPACSAVYQPTATPRTPSLMLVKLQNGMLKSENDHVL